MDKKEPKKIKKIVIFFIFLVAILAILYFFLRPEFLSKDQKQIIKLFGPPSQFVITHLPRGEADNPQLVRSEVWYYLANQKKISFLAGKLVSEEEYTAEGEVEETSLKPEDFDYFMNFSDVADILGEENIEPIDFLPVFYEEEEVATYLSDQALFIIEQDHLTYFQTLTSAELENLGEEDVVLDEDIQTDESEPISEVNTNSDWKTYINSDLKIKLNYPAEWYLEDNDVVLTSYDSGYLEKGLKLLETRLKCDFIKYNPKDVEFDYNVTLLTGEIEVLKGTAVDNSGIDGPGMGDGVMFLISKPDKDSVSLVCFSYDDSFEDDLLKSLETFEFIE